MIFICKFLAIFFLSSASFRVRCDIECQDQQSACDDGSTCCLMESGGYGCCPMPNAVCCSDGVHCCPEGTACDLAQLHCIKNDGTRLISLAKIRSTNKIAKDIQCKDGRSRCPSTSTCCEMPFGRMGCCPMKNAVCCPDKEHCCPEGSTCDVTPGRCLSNDDHWSIPWSTKFEASSERGNSITCDEKFECPDRSTCCKLATGKWGCCPMPDAVCCSDGVHCCPEDTICDVEQGRCLKNNEILTPRTIFFHLMKILETSREWIVKCGTEGKFRCPDGTTCCKLKTGKWGCCPMPRAVCCLDGVHCCPHDTQCDVEEGRCTQNDIRSYFRSKGVSTIRSSKIWTIAKDLDSPGVDKLCPDQKQECESDQTCCLFNSTWSCCPFPEAVCCSNDTSPYCCPKGQKCGPQGQACVSSEIQ